ncbi:MAG TPA: alpha-L-fucosidase, partial [Chitinophagaceae bacterium]|nr:alpha-L-fucosidase [Chitinophagaceae bacterium]
ANDKYKSSGKIVHTLIEVVAKGGSLLLGVGPKPDGTFTDEAIQRLREVGKWMNKNGDAIYNTRATKNYRDGNTWFTQNLKNGMRYALVCLQENEPMPKEIIWQVNIPKKGSKVTLLATGQSVKWSYDGRNVKVILPSSVINATDLIPALVFSFIPAE